MFSHIVLGSNDIPAAKKFYDAVMGALGHAPGNEMDDRVIYAAETGILMVTKPYDGQSATFGNGATVWASMPRLQRRWMLSTRPGSRQAAPTKARPGRGRPYRTATPPICATRPATRSSPGA
jgi:catechol 2,3-dioxygenase-like lactoylglutathione lyase family enzyme